jgi:hypothetical protein
MSAKNKPSEVAFLAVENRKMRDAGCALAEAAMRVVRDYDGVHRLAAAVAHWMEVLANEGGRGDDNTLATVIRWEGDVLRDAVEAVPGEISGEVRPKKCRKKKHSNQGETYPKRVHGYDGIQAKPMTLRLYRALTDLGIVTVQEAEAAWEDKRTMLSLNNVGKATYDELGELLATCRGSR